MEAEDDLANEYKSKREAWNSGYFACIHDFEQEANRLKPWWMPWRIWRRCLAGVWRESETL